MRRFLTLAAVGLVLCGAELGPTFEARAQTAAPRPELPPDPAARLDELQRRIDETSKIHQDLLTVIEDVDRRKTEIDKVVVDLDRQLTSLQGHLREKSRQLDATTGAYVEAERQAIAAGERESELRAAVARRMAAAYKAGPGGYASAVLEARDVNELTTRTAYIRRLVDSDRELATDLAAATALRDKTTSALEDRKRDQFRDYGAVTTVQDKIAANRASQARAQRDLAADLDRKRAALRGIEADRTEWQRMLAKERAEQLGITNFLRDRAGASVAGGVPGLLMWPVIGLVVSPYGWRVHPIYGDTRLHAGLDVDGDEGDPIRAARDGVVIMSTWNGGYGNCVIIDHGNGVATLYAHQSQLTVSAGQGVRMGEVIGLVGSTGLSTGPHLHFEVRIGGEAHDPLPWMTPI